MPSLKKLFTLFGFLFVFVGVSVVASAKTCQDWLITYSTLSGSDSSSDSDAIHDLWIRWNKTNVDTGLSRLNAQCSEYYVRKAIKNQNINNSRKISRLNYVDDINKYENIYNNTKGQGLVEFYDELGKVKTFLSPLQAEALTMRMEGFEYQEIAEELSKKGETIKATTVRKWFSRDIPTKLHRAGFKEFAVVLNKMEPDAEVGAVLLRGASSYGGDVARGASHYVDDAARGARSIASAGDDALRVGKNAASHGDDFFKFFAKLLGLGGAAGAAGVAASRKRDD